MKKSLETIEEIVLDRLRLSSRIEYVFEVLNKKSPNSLTYSSYQFQEEKAKTKLLPPIGTRRPLILIQGVVSKSNDFELKSIKHYLNLDQNQQIIISTWEDEASRKLEETFSNHKGVKILFNEPPGNAGPVNINLQITNTKNGLLEALKDEHEFVVKIRTDQCMMHHRAIENLQMIYRRHNDKEANKIIVNSLNSFLLRPYGTSDMFQFGNVDQLLKYWSAPLDTRSEDEYELNIEGATLRNIAMRNFGETYLGSNYIRTLGIHPNYTLSQSLTYISQNFIVIDNPTTDIIWNKYTYRENRWPNSSKPIPYQQFDHAIWLGLTNNIINLDHLDYLLDKPVWGREFSNE